MQIVYEKNITPKDGVAYLIRGPNIDWGVISLIPGQAHNPHYHNEVEETFYVIEGSITFYFKDKEIEASTGTAIRLEPKESHGYNNKGKIPAKMVFIKHLYRPADKINC